MLHGGYVVFRDIPVGIEGAVSLRSKGVRNLSTPFPPFWGEIISLDGVVYCHPIFQDESLYSGTPHTYIGCRDLRPLALKWGKEHKLERCSMRRRFAYTSIYWRDTLE